MSSTVLYENDAEAVEVEEVKEPVLAVEEKEAGGVETKVEDAISGDAPTPLPPIASQPKLVNIIGLTEEDYNIVMGALDSVNVSGRPNVIALANAIGILSNNAGKFQVEVANK